MTQAPPAAPAASAAPAPAPGPWRRLPLRPLACALSGTAMFLSCATFNLWPLAWIALVPLFLSIRGVPPRRAFWLGWLTGLVANAGGFYWIYGLLSGRFGHIPPLAAFPLFLLLVGYQGLLYGLFAWLVRRLQGRAPLVLAAPVLMVSLEILYWMMFPWYYAITQAWVRPIIQVAEIGGPAAVTFLLVLVNAGVAELAVRPAPGRPRAWRPLAAAAGVVALALLFGQIRIHQIERRRADAPKLKVGLVQANFGILEGERGVLAPAQLRLQREMSADLERQGAELIVWPESAYYYPLSRDQWMDYADQRSVMRGYHTPTIFGALTFGRGRRSPYNSALLVEPSGRITGRFDKNYLMLFGETIPFYESIPWFKKIFPAASNLSRGTEVTVFSLGPYRLGPLICYEDIIPSFVRRVAALRPHLLVNITNDAWFGRTSEPWEHLALAVFRTVEHRMDLVRAVNTGVSAFVDATGRVVKTGPSIDPLETPDPPQTELFGEVALLEPSGLYGRIGDLFGWLNVAGALLLFGRAFVRARRPGGAATS